jgi:hypothetical protein
MLSLFLSTNKSLILIGICALLLIIVVVVVKLTSKDKFTNYKNKIFGNKIFGNEKFETKKVIKFFGATYCPYSNESSISFKVMKDFEEKYKDTVEVQYVWTDTQKDLPLAMEYDIQYVPTIYNENKEIIELGLPEGVDKENKTNDELRELLLNNIYSKL